MPSPAHEILVAALRDDPTILASLLEVFGFERTPTFSPVDSTVRRVDTIEVRPDLLLEAEGQPWMAVEVQHDEDDEKARRWPVLLSILLERTQRMGDLLVLTYSRAVSRWARTAIRQSGPRGTELRVMPVVLEVTRGHLDALLDPAHPALALVAAWAMQKRYGPEARRVVERALEVTEQLDEPMRRAQVRAILGVLNERLLERLRRLAMLDVSKLPEGPALKAWREELEARGELRGKLEGKLEGQLEASRLTLTTLLEKRGFVLSDEQRAQIAGESNVAALMRWFDRAITATSVEEALSAASANAE